jgi:hypothetical protein
MTNFSKGELSPILEGHSDLAAYFEGASILENWLLLRQGGLTRWPGSRMIAEAKHADSDTILWPFEFSVDDAYILEVGHLYIRIFRDKSPVLLDGLPYEIATPFEAADLRTIHTTQSGDVLFTFHGLYAPRKLSRVSDVSWALSLHRAEPSPSFEADADIGQSIAVSANTGNNIPFRVNTASLLAADVGRQIIIGAGVALITTYQDTSTGLCTVIEPLAQTITFPPGTLATSSTTVTYVGHSFLINDYVHLTSGPQNGEMRRVHAILDADTVLLDTAFSADQVGQTYDIVRPASPGTWGLRLSPQTTLDPNRKEPVGVAVTVTAGAAAFRSSDVGKIITVYGGVIELTGWTSTTVMTGIIRSVLGQAGTADPPAAPSGAWKLETPSWSDANGWPRTGDFYQGRLCVASTGAEKTTFWESASDNYSNFAIGVTEEDAVNYPIASRKVNQIMWVSENNRSLAIGTTGAELIASGSGADNSLISGTNPPFIDRPSSNGAAPIQPIQASLRTLLFVDRSRRKIFSLGYSLDADGDSSQEVTLAAEHITKSKVRLGPLAYQSRLDPRLYFVREDGQLVGLTHFPEQKVIGATRRTTQGTFAHCAVNPSPTGESDRVWVVVRRTINGVEKKFIELFEPEHEGLSGRAWPSLQTDCAVVRAGLTGAVISLPHLTGMEVDVIKNGVYLGPHQLIGSTLTLQEDLIETDVLEIGLHYDSSCVSMRPAAKGGVMEGLPRSWVSLFVRVHESKGGKGNGESFEYPTDNVVQASLYTGDLRITGSGYSTDERFTILQDEPYPMTVLCAFGTLDIGEHD